MKDKKGEEAAARQRHKEQLKARRSAEPCLERSEPSLPERPSILIVCEGKNTEPSYFNQFKVSSATVKALGEGYNTISLVERAVELAARGTYDQVWCVFDKDDYTEANFNGAICKAESNGFRVAYSNQAFEYWLILHFEDHQGGGMHRDDYSKKINALLRPYGVGYDGDGCKNVSEDFFNLLDGVDKKTKKRRVDLAIQRAERNYNRNDHQNPGREESSTTVFRLVQELLKYV